MENDYYDKYVKELNKRYEKDPVGAVKLLSNSIKRLKKKDSFAAKLGIDEKYLEIIITIIIGALIILIGLICQSNIGTYILGMIFFIAGTFVSLYVPHYGIAFFFVHGLIGFYFMNKDIFDLLNNNSITNNPSPSLVSYVTIIVFSMILSVLLMIGNSFLTKIRNVKYIKVTIMIIMFLGLLLLRLLPYKLGISDLFSLFN